jgi:hypothetical protein
MKRLNSIIGAGLVLAGTVYATDTACATNKPVSVPEPVPVSISRYSSDKKNTITIAYSNLTDNVKFYLYETEELKKDATIWNEVKGTIKYSSSDSSEIVSNSYEEKEPSSTGKRFFKLISKK